jgi:hypothetical protein
MEDSEKQEWLKLFKGYVLYFMSIAAVSVIKIVKERMKKKKLTMSRLLFIAMASLFFGNLAGIACYSMDVNIVWTLCISNAFALSAEGIMEVFATKSKSTIIVLWDAGVEWLLSWIKRTKKK